MIEEADAGTSIQQIGTVAGQLMAMVKAPLSPAHWDDSAERLQLAGLLCFLHQLLGAKAVTGEQMLRLRSTPG